MLKWKMKRKPTLWILLKVILNVSREAENVSKEAWRRGRRGVRKRKSRLSERSLFWLTDGARVQIRTCSSSTKSSSTWRTGDNVFHSVTCVCRLITLISLCGLCGVGHSLNACRRWCSRCIWCVRVCWWRQTGARLLQYVNDHVLE